MKHLLQLIFYTVVIIAAGVESRTEKDDDDHEPALIAPISSYADIYKMKRQTPQSKISPEKLLLYGKALHKIVESHCSSKVDDLELDAFQAYLNRQLLKGSTLMLSQPLHFNALFQSLTRCADFLSDSNNQVKLLPNSELPAIQTKDDDVGSDTYKKNPLYEKADTLDNSSNTSVASGISATTQPSPTKSSGQNSHQGSILQPNTKSSKKVTKHAQAVSKERTKNTEGWWTEKTVINKLAYNVSTVASNLASSTKQFFQHVADQTSIFFKGWFGRKRRSLEEFEDKDTNNAESTYYSKSPILVPKQLNNESSNQENNYPQVWKSVTASEMRMTAYIHFSHILRYMVLIAVNSCPNQFAIEKNYLETISEFMLVQISNVLVEIENDGMYLKINEKLESDIKECSSDVLAVL